MNPTQEKSYDDFTPSDTLTAKDIAYLRTAFNPQFGWDAEHLADELRHCPEGLLLSVRFGNPTRFWFSLNFVRIYHRPPHNFEPRYAIKYKASWLHRPLDERLGTIQDAMKATVEYLTNDLLRQLTVEEISYLSNIMRQYEHWQLRNMMGL